MLANARTRSSSSSSSIRRHRVCMTVFNSYLCTAWDTDIGIWSLLAWLPVGAAFFVTR